MKLIEILNSNNLSAKQTSLGSDKADPHSYLQNFYEDLFECMGTINSILEIGVWKGASCALWKLKFPSALIVGVDVKVRELHPLTLSFLNSGELEIYEMDAYSSEFFESEKRHFDIIIDDGPHTVESQISALEFRKKLSESGVLVIEDIQDGIVDFLRLRRSLPKNERRSCIAISFTHASQRYDDAVFVYSKSSEVLELLRAKAEEFKYWGVTHPLLHIVYRTWTKLAIKFRFRDYR